MKIREAIELAAANRRQWRINPRGEIESGVDPFWTCPVVAASGKSGLYWKDNTPDGLGRRRAELIAMAADNQSWHEWSWRIGIVRRALISGLGSDLDSMKASIAAAKRRYFEGRYTVEDNWRWRYKDQLENAVYSHLTDHGRASRDHLRNTVAEIEQDVAAVHSRAVKAGARAPVGWGVIGAHGHCHFTIEQEIAAFLAAADRIREDLAKLEEKPSAHGVVFDSEEEMERFRTLFSEVMYLRECCVDIRDASDTSRSHGDAHFPGCLLADLDRAAEGLSKWLGREATRKGADDE